MRKIVTFGIAAVFAALPLAIATMPANAGGISFGFGGGHHYYDDDWYGSGIVIEVEPEDIDDDDDSDMHTSWCENHYQTYDEDTDMYFYAPGKQKLCISPWS